MQKIAKGKDKNTIAEELEEDVDKVGVIIGVASDFAPDYDADMVFKAYMAL